jgi:proteasome beta subunit
MEGRSCVGTDRAGAGRLSDALLSPGTSSFADFLESYAPDLLPRHLAVSGTVGDEVPHGTTIVASSYDGGVVMAGDRRATAGNLIAVRDAEKVFQADEYSVVGYAGSAGIGAELIRLFQVELEHYEKLEGTTLSMEGKANKLGMLLRSNLGLAMQGLAAVPLFAGFDLEAARGRIFSYDVTGGRYEERDFHSIGSGSLFARGALKKLYRAEASRDEAVASCLQALYDAADDDSATGGPDIMRRIFPLVSAVSDEGFERISDEDVARQVEQVIEGRRQRPDGPVATMRTEGRDQS